MERRKCIQLQQLNLLDVVDEGNGEWQSDDEEQKFEDEQDLEAEERKEEEAEKAAVLRLLCDFRAAGGGFSS